MGNKIFNEFKNLKPKPTTKFKSFYRDINEDWNDHVEKELFKYFGINVDQVDELKKYVDVEKNANIFKIIYMGDLNKRTDGWQRYHPDEYNREVGKMRSGLYHCAIYIPDQLKVLFVKELKDLIDKLGRNMKTWERPFQGEKNLVERLRKRFLYWSFYLGVYGAKTKSVEKRLTGHVSVYNITNTSAWNPKPNGSRSMSLFPLILHFIFRDKDKRFEKVEVYVRDVGKLKMVQKKHEAPLYRCEEILLCGSMGFGTVKQKKAFGYMLNMNSGGRNPKHRAIDYDEIRDDGVSLRQSFGLQIRDLHKKHPEKMKKARKLGAKTRIQRSYNPDWKKQPFENKTKIDIRLKPHWNAFFDIRNRTEDEILDDFKKNDLDVNMVDSDGKNLLSKGFRNKWNGSHSAFNIGLNDRMKIKKVKRKKRRTRFTKKDFPSDFSFSPYCPKCKKGGVEHFQRCCKVCVSPVWWWCPECKCYKSNSAFVTSGHKKTITPKLKLPKKNKGERYCVKCTKFRGAEYGKLGKLW